MFATILLAISAGVQFIAAALALRLVRVTGRRLCWRLIATAFCFAAVRRLVTLSAIATGHVLRPPDLASELVGLTISALMLAGVATIGPYFQAIARSQDALARGERRFRRLANATFEGMVIHDENRIIDVNEALGRMLGWETPALVGNRLLRFVAPGDRTTARDRTRSGSVEPYDIHAVKKDGTLFPVSVCTKPLSRDSADVRITAVLDMTERRQAEEALRASEERSRAIADYSFNWEHWVDPDGKVLWINPAVERITGYSVDECLRMPGYPWTLIHEDDRARMAGVFEETVTKRTSGEDVSFRIRRKDEEIRWCAASWQPIFNPEGDCLGHRSSIRDITDRKQAEEALWIAEREKAAVLDGMQEYVVYHDTDLNIIWANRTALAMAGDRGGKVTGRKCYEAWHGRGVSCEGCPVVEAVRTGRSQETKMKISEDRVWLVRGHPVRNNRNEVVGVIEVSQDITAREQADRERIELEEQLRHAQKMDAVGTLSSGIAHDFNNLLTVIFAYTDLARETLPEGHPAVRSLDIVEEASQQASGVTKSLLTFAHKVPTTKALVDLVSVVRESTRLLRRVLSAGIEITDNTASAPAVWVNADATQLQQVIMNMALNARDAMPDGGALNITVRAESDGAELGVPLGFADHRRAGVVLAVEDTGCGIPADKVGRIFEPFFTTKGRGRGTGLGLSVIHSIVADHGGHIGVKTACQKGTRFSVWLPVCTVPPDVVPSSRKDRTPSGRGELVLLVEDEWHIRSIMASTLRAEHHEVIQAKDGVEAMDLVEEYGPGLRLVVLDMDLPKKSGRSCLSDIRTSYPDLPVIIVTGGTSPEFSDELGKRLCVLRKPFQMGELTSLAASMFAEPVEEAVVEA